MKNILAARLDNALANVSDVPTVSTDSKGQPTIHFTGNYANAAEDMAEFLLSLSVRSSAETLEVIREGLRWDSYNGSVTLNGISIIGVSQYHEWAWERV